MDTQHLHAFVAIAEQGSFSAAAEKLHLTQPAISKRIALLEDQLGTRLFDRIGRQVILTAAGKILLNKAQLILSEVTATQRAIADLRGEIQGQLSIATSHHVGLHYLPPVLREFSSLYSEVKLDLHFLDSEQAYEEILNSRYDLAVVTLSLEQDPRLETYSIWQDQLQFVAAPDHPLATQPHLQLADLTQHQAILPDLNTYTTKLVKNLFDQENLPLNINMVTNHLESIKMMLSIGLGWGVLPNRLIDHQVQRLNVKHKPLIRPLGIIHHKQRSLSNTAKAFIDLMKTQPIDN
jgi:DNA-binding transcriptional LysR family regulator